MFVVAHRVVDAHDSGRVTDWRAHVGLLARELNATMIGSIGSLSVMTLDVADLRALRERLLAHVEAADAQGVKSVYGIAQVEDGDVDDAVWRAECLVCTTTLPGVRLGRTLPLSSIVPALGVSLFPAHPTDAPPPGLETVQESPFLNALAHEDWALAQEYVDAAVERSSDPRAFERLTALVELARGHTRVAGRLLRRSVGERVTDGDTRAALALAVAELCEGDLVHALRDGATALAYARASGQPLANLAAERFVRLALDRYREAVAESPQDALA